MEKESSKITELIFDKGPNEEALKFLFQNNNVKSVENVQNDTLQCDSTERIEELHITFCNVHSVRSFEGVRIHFFKIILK